ncbi:MAG: penicillin-binding protein 2 [Candidatus Bruticola sp.]
MRSCHFHIFVIFACCCALILAGRLIFMQIIEADYYAKCSADNLRLNSPIMTGRGIIYDRRGRIMARNEAVFTLRMIPYVHKNPEQLIEKVASILHLSQYRKDELLAELKDNEGEAIVISDSLDPISLARFAEAQDEVDGLRVEVKFKRVYPHDKLAAHVLGYVGEIDGESLAKLKHKGYIPGEWIGKDGLELAYEDVLHGRSGLRSALLDPKGRFLGDTEKEPAIPGDDIYCAIDLDLQRKAQSELTRVLDDLAVKNGERSGGAVVAMEPYSGYVRALVSLPHYNPNEFAAGISYKKFNVLLNDTCSPLLNRAVHGAYPPGSTFKLITTSAALNEGIITPFSRFYCTGKYNVAGLVFNCFVRSGHGSIDLRECLGYSCDSVYYEIGPKLGIKRLHKYAEAFGLGHKTGLDLPGESEGCIPTPDWKEKVFGEKWFPGDDANAAIGQGFVTASPLQMAAATSAVVTDGIFVVPRLVERRHLKGRSQGQSSEIVYHSSSRRLPIKQSYFQYIKDGMRLAVTEGTAVSSGGDLIGVAGKTGTAENVPTTDNPHGLNHCWFVGYAPYGYRADWQAPPLVVAAFVEKSGGYGGAVAAPIAVKVLDTWNKIYKEKDREAE